MVQVEPTIDFALQQQIVKDLFFADEQLEAMKVLKIIGKSFTKTQDSCRADSQLTNGTEEAVAEFMDSELVTTLRNESRILKETIDELNGPMGDWSRFKDTRDYKVFYKMEPGVTSLSVYMEGTVNAPVLNVLAVLAEA